jgi:hypothetical protein
MRHLRNTLSALTLATSLLMLKLHSAQAQITNPVTGNLGDDIAGAESGMLFVKYFVYLWYAVMVVGAIIVVAYFIGSPPAVIPAKFKRHEIA